MTLSARSCACLVVGVVLVGTVPLGAQSLADVAKKEEERRQQVKEPAKTYTNKDLGPVPATSALPAEPAKAETSSPAKDDATKAEGDDKGKGEVKDQKYWSAKQKDLQSALDRDQTLADAMQTRINSLTTDFVNRDDPAQRALIDRDRQKALGELDRLKKQIVADKKALDDLQEEARHAGVPPGWLRS